MDASKALNISEEREEHSRGKADCPRKDKEKERRKHDQKVSNDIADWKWEKRRVTTRRVAATYYSNARNREQEKKKMQIENAIRIP